MQLSSIILAGGKSTRMGTDKTFLKLEGKTLLETVVELVKLLCSSIIISSNNSVHEKLGYPVIPDEIEDCGPIGGIYTCLKKSKADWNFVISVDSPFVEVDFIKSLISEIGDSDAVIPIHKNGKEPLIALYNKSCLNEIEKMIELEQYKMHFLLKSLKVKFVDSNNWLEKYPKLFHNINRPEDL